MKFCFILTITLFLFLCDFERIDATVTVYDEKNLTIIDYDDSAAAFGPRIPENGFKGYIVPANPIDGCKSIEPPPNVSFVDPNEWIALIKRTPGIYNNCSFDVKVHNAQNAGFKAVIVYNSDSDTLITMSSSGKFSIKIPSIFVGYSTGNELKNEFTYTNGTYVVITSDENDLSYLLIPFVCVVSICFIIAISIFIVKLALHCHKIRKNRFPRSALKKIPTKKYQKTDKYDTCPICLNEYEEGVKIRILPCEHAYHIECIDKWLLRNNRCCPVCKRRVIPGDPESDNDDSDTGLARNVTNSITVEHEANEDEDTNESSRLLLNNRNQNDDQSICTTSTILNSQQSNNNNDISSLNNQMQNSINSTQLPNKELRSSSSKYGSISSINQLPNSSSMNAFSNQACVDTESLIDESDASKRIKIPFGQNFIDSKASPDDFHTPQGLTSEVPTDQGISSSPYTLNLDNKNFHLKKNENLVQTKSKKSSAKSNSESKENESNSKTKKSKNSKKITPININTSNTNENIATTSSTSDVNDQTNRVEDNLEHFESCKEDLTLMTDNVALIQPNSDEKKDEKTMPSFA